MVNTTVFGAAVCAPQGKAGLNHPRDTVRDLFLIYGAGFIGIDSCSG